MLYVFLGDDTQKRIKALEDFLSKESRDLEIFSINSNDFASFELENFYSGESLFFKKCTIVMRDIFDKSETGAETLRVVEKLVNSTNTFIIVETKLPKVILDNLSKAGAVIYKFELPKIIKERFDNFLVANSFESGDKVGTWLNFRKAMDLGVEVDEISGVMFWKLKDMVSKHKFNKFQENKLKQLIINLSYLLPEARRKNQDTEIVLEKFLLEAF